VELGLKRNNVLCEQKGIGVGIVREEGWGSQQLRAMPRWWLGASVCGDAEPHRLFKGRITRWSHHCAVRRANARTQGNAGSPLPTARHRRDDSFLLWSSDCAWSWI